MGPLLIWAAGFFDGEGSTVCRSTRHPNGHFIHSLGVSVTQAGNDGVPSELKELQNLFGGSTYKEKRLFPGKQKYKWQARSKMARTALASMLLYLHEVKQEQADQARVRCVDRRDLGQAWELERRRH